MSLILAAIAFLAATNAEREPVEFTKDSLEVVKQNVDDGKAVMVDVRNKVEWDKGHLEDSSFLPVSAIRKGKYPPAMTKALPKDKTLYTFCVVGMRAKKAAAALGKQGYEVRALKPGYDELIEAGFKKADDEDTR
jgi:phage shock protein E